MGNKLVSIIMPAYNRASTILRAIDSVFAQTYTEWELIIVDDCSSDNTQQLLREKYNLHSKIKYIRSECNIGPAGARNIGIDNSRGDYLAFLDSDDEWLHCHLDNSVRLLEKTNRFICSALWKEEKGGICESISQSDWYKDSFEKMMRDLKIDHTKGYILFGDNFFEYIINTGFYCFHINTIVMNRIIINEIGKFDESLKASEDMDFLYRIFEKYNLVFNNQDHFIYHYGKDNIYAFLDRDNIYTNKNDLSAEVKRKLLYTLVNKIAFFVKLNERMKKKTNYKKVKKSIKLNILRRYLTISYLEEKTPGFVVLRYGLKYAMDLKTFLMTVFYKKEKFINIYFCDD